MIFATGNCDGAWWARGPLGAIFLTTAIAKLPQVREFAVALEKLTGLPPPAAAGVIVLEMAIGAMLLLGIRARMAGIGALLLGGVFTGIQVGRIFYGVASPCHCLGVLGELPAAADLGLDLLIVVLSFIVIWRKGEGALAGQYGWLAVVIPLGFVSLSLNDLPPLTRSHETVLQKLKGEEKPTQEKCVVLCLNLDEFHCSICFDDLTALLDTLLASQGADNGHVAAAIRSTDTASAWGLRRWARETGIDGPVAILTAGEFDEATGGGSALWITRGLDRILQIRELPLGVRGRGEVLSSLREP
jgi:hypothetical protein